MFGHTLPRLARFSKSRSWTHSSNTKTLTNCHPVYNLEARLPAARSTRWPGCHEWSSPRVRTHTSCAGARAATHISHAHHTRTGTLMNMFRIGAACDTSIPELTHACAPQPFPRTRHSTHQSGHPASRWPHLPWALHLTLQYTSVALCVDEHMKDR